MSADKQTAERIQDSKNREAFSDYIAVAESTWYDFAPVLKAILKEIAFMEVYDLKKVAAKIRKDNPNKQDMEGWCFASQGYLAARIGTTDPVVYQAVQRFVKDRVIEERTWTDTMGRPHNEYRINRAAVDSKHWPEDLGKFLDERKAA